MGWPPREAIRPTETADITNPRRDMTQANLGLSPRPGFGLYTRMPKKPGTNPKGEFAFFNVVYEDGSLRSNRRVPMTLLEGLEGDKAARGFIMEQDREIAERSGRPVLAIKSISRVGAKKK